MVHCVSIVRTGFIVGATIALPSKSRTVGNFLVREHQKFSKVGFLQSDGGTVLSEEIEFAKKNICFRFNPFYMTFDTNCNFLKLY